MPLVTNQPLSGEIGLITVVVGAVLSIFRVIGAPAVSMLPALSVLQNPISCVPSVPIGEGAAVGLGSSTVDRVVRRVDVGQVVVAAQGDLDRVAVPAALLGSATVGRGRGAVRSILMPSTVLVAVLPAMSVQLAVEERLPPSPFTIVSAGWPAGPDSRSVQVQLTVTSPVCQPPEKDAGEDGRRLVDVDARHTGARQSYLPRR